MTQESLRSFSDSQSANPVATGQPVSSDERGTPRRLIRALRNANGGLFAIDIAAGSEPTQIGAVRLTKADNALTSTWDPKAHEISSEIDEPVTPRSGWLNPPFSKNKAFASKLDTELSAGYLDYVIFLCSAQSLAADWYHDHVLTHAEYLCIPDQRYSFSGSGDNPSFPSVLTAVGDVPPPFVSLFEKEGQAVSVLEKIDAAVDLHQFVKKAVRDDESSEDSITTTDSRDGPVLNDVRRGSRLRIRIQGNGKGYPDTVLGGERVPVTVRAWKETENAYEVLTTLNADTSPYEQEVYILLTVQQHSQEAVTSALHHPDQNDWQPIPLRSVRTATTHPD